MNRPHFPMPGRNAAAGDPRSNSGLVQRSVSGIGSSSVVGRTEIENLRQLMRMERPLANERLAELRDKVAQGVYLTREAAEVTASRMLDDNFDLS